MLVRLISESPDDGIRGCAAHALIDLGETGIAMDSFVEWSRGSNASLRRTAVTGFGKIGQPAARIALPFFAEMMKSREVADRWFTIEALENIGPTGRPLIEAAAAQDPDTHVRAKAEQALRRR